MARLVSRRFGVPLMAAVAVSVGTGVAPAAAPTSAVPSLARVYGIGVHAYYSRDHQRSYDDLTQAIEAGSNDPRVWYFRGLAARKLGRFDEAEADFSTAAAREAEAVAEWDVARALERVQGADRMAIERHRMRAGVAKQQSRLRAAERRYVETDRRQPEVQRQIRPKAPAEADDPLGMFTDGVRETDDAGDPQPVAPGPAEDAAAPADDAAPRGGADLNDDPLTEPDADDQPAAGDELPADKPIGDEPFADDPLTDPASDGTAPAKDTPLEPAAEQPEVDTPAGDEPMAERDEPPPADAPSSDVFTE